MERIDELLVCVRFAWTENNSDVIDGVGNKHEDSIELVEPFDFHLKLDRRAILEKRGLLRNEFCVHKCGHHLVNCGLQEILCEPKYSNTLVTATR
jgi:hypothetical protein